MKTRIVLLLCLIILSANASHALAQKYTSPVKEIYDNVSDKNASISAVYITSDMLKFSMSLAAAFSNDKQIDSLLVLVKNMDEIILLKDMPSSVFSDDQVVQLHNTLMNNGYNTMAQLKEGGQELDVFMLEGDDTNKIRDLVVIVKEKNGRMVLSITGNMTIQQLATVASLANIDIAKFISR